MEAQVRVVEDLVAAVEVIGEVFGWRDAYYAREAAHAASGVGLVALADGERAGAVVAYAAPGPLSLGIVYYIAVRPRWRGRGLGRVLLASAEEALEWLGAEAFLATASAGNEASATLFSGMGYTVKAIWEAAGEIGWEAVDALLHAACSYEDDLVMVKPWEPRRLSRLSPEHYRDTWWRACYTPWLKLYRRRRRPR